MFTLPALKAMNSTGPLGWLDYLLAGIFLALVLVEFVADQQQYAYQQEKYRRKKAGEALGDYYGVGFTHTGFWDYMRHPNYAAEQSIWISFYFFSVIATGHWINWSIPGALLLVLLFVRSSDFSESISKEKYPKYELYI